MLNLINVLEVTEEATTMCMGIEVPNKIGRASCRERV